MNNLIEKLRSDLPRVYNRAFRYVYQEAYKPCARLVIQRTKDEQLAEDIFQDAMCILLKKVKQPEFILTAHIKTYMYGICKNLLLQKLERNSKKAVHQKALLIQQTITENIETFDLTEYRLTCIKKALESFEKEDCKTIIKLFYLEGKRLIDLAKIMNYTPGSIKSKRYDCIKYLRKKVFSIYKN